MYYEFYIDQFFLEHALTDGMLLLLTAWICREKIGLWKLAAGSMVASGIMLVLVCTGYEVCWPFAMVAAEEIAFWRHGKQKRRQLLFCLFLLTLCFGGIVEGLMQLAGFGLMAAADLAVFLLWRGITLGKEEMQGAVQTAEVTLILKQRSVKGEGLVDTGNRLTEPMTHRPVSVLCKTLADELLWEHWEEEIGYLLIPYHSIGKEKGWMRAVTLDCMQVRLNGSSTEVVHPVLAICEGSLSQDEHCQIILHPEHVKGAEEHPGSKWRNKEKSGGREMGQGE